MKCSRCLNTDPAYFYKGSRGWYCRRCISFGRAMLEEDRKAAALSPVKEGAEEYVLKYPLTPRQKAVSEECAQLIETGDVLLHCVCGAGKTELVVPSIAKMLKAKKKVCFAIPRRQVVLELRQRLASYFPEAEVIAVCGGHTGVTDCAGLIICTTHQLYRYYRAFDLLILDEPDAFPFRGNPVLQGIAQTAVKGRMILLTATPDKTMQDRVLKGELTEVKLMRRPHGHDLPVPRLFAASLPVLLMRLLFWVKSHHGPRMIFAPTIHSARLLHRFLSLYGGCFLCTSKTEGRDEVIESFRRKKDGVIVCTTVLERGVTVEGADICVFLANHGVFDKASLIQMAGRAGRSFAHPDGDVLFLLNERSREAESCRNEILEANRCAA